jgi:hypothetical protein
VSGYSIWQYLHILLFVYWLGADLGVFLASRYVARADLPLEERLRFLELLLKIDMGPRTALILIVPVGFQLATQLGIAPFASGAMPLIWLAALAWLGLAWWLYANARTPAAQPLARLDQGVRVAVSVGFTGLGAWSWFAGTPLEARWLAAKFVLFACVVVIGLLLRVTIRDWVRGFGMLRAGEDAATADGLILGAYQRATGLARALWLLVAAVAFLGVTKPLLS